MTAAEYRSLIREVPDFPKPGILFYDITTLLKDSKAFSAIADGLVAYYGEQRVAKVVGIESRGFILGESLAATARCGLRPGSEAGEAACRQLRSQI